MDFNTNLFRRPTQGWPTHQLISIYTETSPSLADSPLQWAYKLKTLDPTGLKDNDFFFVQNRRSRRT